MVPCDGLDVGKKFLGWTEMKEIISGMKGIRKFGEVIDVEVARPANPVHDRSGPLTAMRKSAKPSSQPMKRHKEEIKQFQPFSCRRESAHGDKPRHSPNSLKIRRPDLHGADPVGSFFEMIACTDQSKWIAKGQFF